MSFSKQIKKILESYLRKGKSDSLRKLLLQLLYIRKGMRFQDFRNFNDQFYLFKVDDTYLPTELPYWNVTFEQYLINCRRISLAYCQLNPGDVVIDIGAGLGEEAVVYARLVGPTGKVYCLEPHPQVFQVLNEAVALNSLNNVQTFPYALYHSNEMISIVDEEELYESSYVGSKSGTKTFPVEGIRFDTFFGRISADKIKLLKVNIEGSERYLLNPGFLPYFKRIEHIAVACHDFRFANEGNEFFKTKDEVIRFFTDAGFKVWHQKTGEPFLDDWVYITPQ